MLSQSYCSVNSVNALTFNYDFIEAINDVSSVVTDNDILPLVTETNIDTYLCTFTTTGSMKLGISVPKLDYSTDRYPIGLTNAQLALESLKHLVDYWY